MTRVRERLSRKFRAASTASFLSCRFIPIPKGRGFLGGVGKNKNLPSYSSSTHPRLAADAVEVGTCSSGNTEVIATGSLPLLSACGQLTGARSPRHIAEVTLYFSWRVPKNRSSNKFLVIPLLLLVYHKIRRLSKNLCAFPPAAYVLTDLEAGESTHVFS